MPWKSCVKPRDFVSKNIFKKIILEEHEAPVFLWGTGKGAVIDYVV